MHKVVIGLEVHVHLNTASKIFCACSAKFGAPPNSHSCPVCLGFPGSLPVLNEKALEHAIKVALALNCKIRETIKFDRKNYFYPDLPKNFQISQYDMPLASQGYLELHSGQSKRNIAIKRVHLEEDAGKLLHEKDYSFIDYNRSGIPLLEIVTEPQIYSPQEAYEFLKNLKLLIQYLDVSDCDMEKGSLRCDANISVKNKDQEGLGIKVELKNMNSFKAVRAALEFEKARQIDLLQNGKDIVQETRLWDEKTLKTVSMRSKEETQDYRYFPEPDLPNFVIDKNKVETFRRNLPLLPQKRIEHFIEKYDFRRPDAEILVSQRELADFFEDCRKLYRDSKNLFNWINGPLLSELNRQKAAFKEMKLTKDGFVRLLELIDSEKISNLRAKDVLREMVNSGKAPDAVIEEKDLGQISGIQELEGIVEKAVSQNKKSVEDYKKGKKNAIMFIVGQVMKETKGKANPKMVKEILEKRLG